MVSEGQKRFAKCKLAVNDVLTDIMQQYLERSKTEPEKLYELIMSKTCDEFRKKLSQEQFVAVQTLTTDRYKKLDINLIYRIARSKHFQMLITDRPTYGWGNYPQPDNDTTGDNMERIRKCRNDTEHRPPFFLTDMKEEDFNKLFHTLIDIGQRADKHFTSGETDFEKRVRHYQTCNFDEEKIKELERENQNLKKILEVLLTSNSSVDIYIDGDMQRIIDDIQKGSAENKHILIKITMYNIENAAQKAEILNSHSELLNTKDINFISAEHGSLVVYLKAESNLFSTDKLMKQKLEVYIKKLYAVADLEYIPADKCYIVITAGSDFHEDISDDNEGDSSCTDDLILHLEINKKGIQNNESLYKNVNELLKNITSITNGQLLTSEKKMTLKLEPERETKNIMQHSSQDVSEWLDTIDLQELSPKFATEDVSLYALVEMDKDDLIEIGVDKRGNWVRILKHAKNLNLEVTFDSMPSEVKEVSTVLSFIGFPQYTKPFEQEDIGIQAFCEITDDDLKELQILKKGPRVLILAASRKLAQTWNKDKDVLPVCPEDEFSFLQMIGLQGFNEIFRAEVISLRVIPHLTQTDLIELGIKKKGPRLLFIAAAKKLESIYSFGKALEYSSTVGFHIHILYKVGFFYWNPYTLRHSKTGF